MSQTKAELIDGKGDVVFDTDTLAVDATNNRVGIGEVAPGTQVEVNGAEPYITIKNSTEEDADGGRESRIIFEGEQSGGEISTLAQIEVSHDGAADDEKGKIVFSTNDGSDGAVPTAALTISSDQTVAIANNLTVNGVQYPTTGALSNRNLIINGAMQVAQRGTSATNLGDGDNGYHTVDRFRFNEQGTPTCEFTNTQSTDAPSGFSNSFRLDTTTAESPMGAANTVYIDYRVEAQDLQRLGYGTADAKSITLSFYVKSTVSGTYVVWFYTPDGAVACTHTYTIAAGEVGTWQYRTITIAGDTSNVIDNDNAVGMFIRFVLCAGTDWTSGTASTTWAAASVTDANRFPGHTANVASSTTDDWSITGVQLEVGTVATPFEHRAYSDELQRCQRYLFRVNGNALDETAIGTGHVRNNTTIQTYVNLPVTMRDVGAVTENNMEVITGATVASISLSASLDEGTTCIGVALNADTGTPFTTGQGAIIRLGPSTAAFFQVESEL